MFTDVGSSSPDISYGSSEGLPVGTTPPHPAHVAIQHGFPPYHSSPILSYPRSGTSQSTNQMLRSLMESQTKVLSVVENVSQRIDDLEQLVQAVTSTEGNASSSLNAAKARVPSQLTV